MTSPFNAVRPFVSISCYPIILIIGNKISSTTHSHAVMFGCEGMIPNVTRHDENPTKPPNISAPDGIVAGGVISGIVIVVIVGGICFAVIVAFGVSRKKRVIDFRSTRMEKIIAANSEAETKYCAVTEKGDRPSFETPSAPSVHSKLQYSFQQATSGNGSTYPTTVTTTSFVVTPQSTTVFESDTDDISTQDLVDVGST